MVKKKKHQKSKCTSLEDCLQVNWISQFINIASQDESHASKTTIDTPPQTKIEGKMWPLQIYTVRAVLPYR